MSLNKHVFNKRIVLTLYSV